MYQEDSDSLIGCFFVFLPIILLYSIGSELSAKRSIGEYYCYKHGGLVSIEAPNYNRFTCEDGSSWRADIIQERPPYEQ